jgi:hypothetical protein
MKVLRMMSYTVLAMLGMGVLVVMLLLAVPDPLEGARLGDEGDSRGFLMGAEDQSGPASFSMPRR